LQHGNETTAWEALRRVLQQCAGCLPRSLILYFGNLQAAAQCSRQLPGQPDFNRNWPGTDLPPHPIQPVLGSIAAWIRAQHPLAAIDFHNNSGANPYYAAVNSQAPEVLGLAALFADIGVYFSYPRGVQAMALLSRCPAITVECGQPGSDEGITHTLQFMHGLLHLERLPDAPAAAELSLYHMTTSIVVAEGLRVEFGSGPRDGALVLRDDLDRLNFTRVPAGTVLGWCQRADALVVRDQQGRAAPNTCIELCGQAFTTTRDWMPAMLSCDRDVIRDDCLGYLMEKMDASL